MKSFCLVAMAGIGNIPGILGASILLGVSENFLKAFRGLRGWADIVFFVLIITVILGRSIKGRRHEDKGLVHSRGGDRGRGHRLPGLPGAYP
ncbi:MAG: hypothetical protein H7A27_00695 [Spirochaetaceae bacterium]|nr:hypothetical protein [Spirochaetaceae bacterium]